MFGNKSILAIIPARGGSKGVHRKNIKDLLGKPLIAWTIEEAKKSKYIDRLILSSEDQEIIDVAKSFGCEVPFVRPIELAQDDTPGIAPVLHAVQQLPRYEYVVLLQPTSPLRKAQDIDEAIEKSIINKGVAVVSVAESDENPYWMYYLDSNNSMTPLININKIPLRRQDLPKAYILNGAIYVSAIDILNEEKSFIQKQMIAFAMPRERSIDVDSELDFKICEAMMKYKE